jgi:hypothetical protein
MKMFFVGYDEYFDDTVTNAFRQAGCESYLKLYDGKTKETRSSGNANALFMPVSDEEIPHLVEIVRGLKAEYPTVNLRAFTFPVEECI